MKRREAWVTNESNRSAKNPIKKLRASWKEPDARGLEEIYGLAPQWNKDHLAFAITEFRVRLNELGVTSVSNMKVDG